jgi:hypothetical protein
MSTGMSASMATMPMWMRRNKHLKPVMDQCRMWRTEGILVESVMIGLYFQYIAIAERYNVAIGRRMA